MAEGISVQKNICLNCGEEHEGKFCHKCGEKKLNREDFTVKKFFTQTIDVFTHFDSNVLKSAWMVTTKPGLLAAEYIRGKRVPYSKPVQLFFLINIVYFLVLYYIGFDVVTNPLKDHMNHFVYGGLATSMVNEKLQSHKISMNDYENKFYDTIYVDSKLLIILMIPLFALFLKLIFFRQKRLYYEHLVFATYFFCFILLFYTFILNTFDYIIYYFTEYNLSADTIIEVNDFLALIIVLSATFIYLFFALQETYKISSVILFLKTILSVISLVAVVTIYSFFLFLLVYYTT